MSKEKCHILEKEINAINVAVNAVNKEIKQMPRKKKKKAKQMLTRLMNMSLVTYKNW